MEVPHNGSGKEPDGFIKESPPSYGSLPSLPGSHSMSLQGTGRFSVSRPRTGSLSTLRFPHNSFEMPRNQWYKFSVLEKTGNALNDKERA
jgi:hypothetical protein